MVSRLSNVSTGNAVDNYSRFLCIPLIGKLLSGGIAEKIYKFHDVNDILPMFNIDKRLYLKMQRKVRVIIDRENGNASL